MANPKDEQIAALALEIIEDAEMSRTSAETLVLKASRLARLVGDEEAILWLWYERHGYLADEPTALKYVSLTDRWVNHERKNAYLASITVQEGMVTGCEHELEAMKRFVPSGNFALNQLQEQQSKIMGVTTRLLTAKKIVSAVVAEVQAFASRVYSEKLFSHEAGTIFEQYKERVDTLLASTAESAFARLPHAFERLSTGDSESISHALSTCRRVIDSFADAVFPPRDAPALIGTQGVEVGQPHTRNRLRAYIHGRVGQSSRYERLNKNLTSLYDRVSAGVHADVDAEEAQALVLQTYLFLGELLSLPKPSQGSGG